MGTKEPTHIGSIFIPKGLRNRKNQICKHKAKQKTAKIVAQQRGHNGKEVSAVAGYENIKDRGFDTLSPEERKKRASEGGKASAEARRRKRLMEQEADILLSRPCKTKKGKAALEELGYKGGSNQMAMIAQQVIKAMEGDMSALNWLRDILGERPIEASSVAFGGTDDFQVNINVSKD